MGLMKRLNIKSTYTELSEFDRKLEQRIRELHQKTSEEDSIDMYIPPLEDDSEE